MLDALTFAFAKLQARTEHARVQRGKIILPREIRGDLIEGRQPAVTTWGREPCPIKKGMTYTVTPNLTLVFSGRTRRTAKGHHRCLYTLRDFRPVTLTTRPPASDARRRERQHWSPEEEHGYSHSADVLDAGDVLDPVARQEEDDKAETRRKQQETVAAARRERYELEQRLGRVRDRAALERIDISKDVRVIAQRIEAIERRVLDKAA